MLTIEHLSLSYGKRALLKDASLSIADGEHAAIIGANGCGKSTLLRALIGLRGACRADGVVSIDGIPIASMAPAERSRRIALIPQGAAADFPLRAEDYVMLGRTARLPRWAPPAAEDRAAVRSALKLVGAESLARAFTMELSDGERQRLSIALALASGAGVLLLDEPSAHLDIRYRAMLIDLLASLKDKTVLMVLHDLDWARRLKRVLLFDGDSLRDGPPGELLSDVSLREAFSLGG